MKSIYPTQNNPYYIVAPPFVRSSAGIRLLYLLCHHLNLKGYQAFIALEREECGEDEVHDYIAPIVNEQIITLHFKTNRQPIVVYPEVISGNPLCSDAIARYVLNYPGLLGGDKEYDKDEMVFAYTKKLSDSVTCHKSEIMYVPLCDVNIFYPPKTPVKREGSCFYASKYQHSHNGKLQDITKDSFEITRGEEDSLNQYEIAELLRKSEIFYTYEDTSLAIEATLCGCPTVFITNEFLQTEPLASKEIGDYGMAFGVDLEKLQQAKKTVDLAFDKYQKSIELFGKDIDNFINITQLRVQNMNYTNKIYFHKSWYKTMTYIAKDTIHYYKKNGFKKTIIKIKNVLSR